MEGLPGPRNENRNSMAQVSAAELSDAQLGTQLLPLHLPLALWPPGPVQWVPSPPTGEQRRHKAMGRYTDPQLP